MTSLSRCDENSFSLSYIIHQQAANETNGSSGADRDDEEEQQQASYGMEDAMALGA